MRLVIWTFLLLLTHPLAADAELEALLAMPAKRLASWNFNPRTPLADRLQVAPPFLLDYLRRLDRMPSYEAAECREIDRADLTGYLAWLPPLHRRTLEERLLGFYFIKDFQGSGLADFALDDRTNFYFFIVFNPAVLNRGLDTQFTYRERTCFKPTPPWSVRVESGADESGLLYVLLHEATHGVDYVHGLTPLVVEGMRRYRASIPAETPFTRAIWRSYDVPVPSFQFHGRPSISFYGFDRGPKMDLLQGLSVYRALTNTPFATLYGAQNWAEDLADLTTLYCLEKRGAAPLRIVVEKQGVPVETFHPTRNPRVQARFTEMEARFR